ncbi:MULTISPECIES: metal-sulfur cluster assembly factor [Geobacillus]|uniref:metal-sulfur cluster assembly factor n=1 Tax=Geobacillus TaxID=129337 RepID=UPI000C293A5F|nr:MULTISPECIES: metal-sulfur cluster assembly factor [Geobacillus]PJW17021.1 FeS assembly SUF system protein [Geobacillus sp. WSUCF-018B]QIZ66860.1 metal-sulfur cluster assembly factor [Geobacillus subterraneus]QOR84922.1 metal-sulfur cluster assembly factor [Geobacillus stearothermophilus]WJQ07838.1 metal-sulfur cluster assembly factor [Geobacillus stearothermophilus]
MDVRELAIQQLKTVLDPELGINVVDLGLIYDLKIEDGHINVLMTLTTPGCPLHDSIAGGVKRVLEHIDGIRDVRVQVTWNPPWTPERMSEDALRQLGHFTTMPSKER